MADFTDDFNRADSADLGANWDPTSVGGAKILSNVVRATTINVNAEESVNAYLPTADQFARLTLATFTGAGVMEAGLLLRCAAPTTRTFYALQAYRNSGTNTSAIVRSIAGAGTNLIIENSTTWAATDVLEGRVVNTRIILLRNGVELLRVEDASIASGRVGIQLYTQLDLSRVEIDSFVGGSLPRPMFRGV